jgi:hypothetical protein
MRRDETMRHFKGASLRGMAVLLWVAITFSSAQGGGTPRIGPADLYDMESIKNMTLADLKYQETDRYTIGDSILVILGDWSNGEWATFDKGRNPRTITLHQRAALYLPLGVPRTTKVGLVKAAHISSSVDSRNLAMVTSLLGIPLLAHGEYRVDWDTLGYRNRNELMAASFENMVMLNPMYPSDFITGNLSWLLPHTDMCAITLLQRLASQGGWHIKRVGLAGGSKEGYACWVASAVDDRIDAACPGAYQFEDFLYGLYCYGTDWNWEDYGLLGPIMDDLRLFYQWLGGTPAGEAARRYFSVDRFKQDLHPRVFSIHGDVTLPGMHDADYYPLGAESRFLESFTERNWRYNRRPNEREGQEFRLKTLLYLTGVALSTSDEMIDNVFPKVMGVKVCTTKRRRFRVLAYTSEAADSVRLWWSHSESRRWNEEGQAPWVSARMERQPDGSYLSQWQQAPPLEEIGYYVEAESRYYVKPYRFPCRDASPVRFLWPLPPHTAHTGFVGRAEAYDYVEAPAPARYRLCQSHPNPFNLRTVINYQLPVDGYTKLEVFNLLGQKVASLVDSKQQTGHRSVVWDASEVASGIYFYKLSAGDFTETRRMTLVK